MKKFFLILVTFLTILSNAAPSKFANKTNVTTSKKAEGPRGLLACLACAANLFLVEG